MSLSDELLKKRQWSPEIIGALKRFLFGFAVGWIAYMIAVFDAFFLDASNEDGAFGLYAQSFIGIFFSLTFTIACWLIGLVFYIPPIGFIWKRCGKWIFVFSIVGAGIYFFSGPLGLSHLEVTRDLESETERQFVVMETWALNLSYFLVIFPFVNWFEKTSAIDLAASSEHNSSST